jgi:imidazolonepropionase-like amidohydrolase
MTCVILVLTVHMARAGEEIPGADQKQPIVLTNATVHIGNGSRIERGSVLFDAGKIVAIGTNVQVPATAQRIDCSGKHIYPGFITPESILGLTEIGAVRATHDNAEVGRFNPNVRAETAYNPDSEIIPTIRSNGVLLANVMPTGGIVSGQSSLMRLDGWTREDIAIQPRSAMVMNWVNMHPVNAWWMEKTQEEQHEEISKRLSEIDEFFREAYAYTRGADVGLDTTKIDIRYEAMRRVFNGSLPLIVNASTQRQMEAAMDLAKKYDLRLVINGATEAEQVIDRLKSQRVAVILQRVNSLPRRDEDPYDQAFTLPALLVANGIQFCLSAEGFWRQRDLPFEAGTARAFGLAEEEAVKAITLSAASIFGVDDAYGSLEVGKSATLFVSSGDALDVRTNVVEQAWIDGRSVDLDNKHKRLSRKYRERYQR